VVLSTVNHHSNKHRQTDKADKMINIDYKGKVVLITGKPAGPLWMKMS